MELVKVKNIVDSRGKLTIVEGSKDIPFDIKRMYFISGVEAKERRGFHAHKKLKQLLVCITGSCKILLDDGKNKHEVFLNDSNQGVLILNPVWREMYEFSQGCVLAVFADEHYNESDYIRDYDIFKKMIER